MHFPIPPLERGDMAPNQEKLATNKGSGAQDAQSHDPAKARP